MKEQEKLEEFINSQPKLGTKEFNDLASAYFGGNPKQETLEEFAKVEAMKQYSEDTFGNLVVRKSIEKGAKWQQEQQDELAIGFAEWCDDNYFRMGNTSIWSDSTDWEDNIKFTTKELYEIYKIQCRNF